MRELDKMIVHYLMTSLYRENLVKILNGMFALIEYGSFYATEYRWVVKIRLYGLQHLRFVHLCNGRKNQNYTGCTYILNRSCFGRCCMMPFLVMTTRSFPIRRHHIVTRKLNHQMHQVNMERYKMYRKSVREFSQRKAYFR